MRIFYIAGIAVAVIVVVAVISVCVAAIRKKKNVDALEVIHPLDSNDGNSSFAYSSGLPCLILCQTPSQSLAPLICLFENPNS